MAWSNLMPWSSNPAKPVKFGTWHPVRVRLAKDSAGGSDYALPPALWLPRAEDNAGGGDYILMTADTDSDLQIRTSGQDNGGGSDYILPPILFNPRAYDSAGGGNLIKWGVYGFDEAGGSDYALPPEFFLPRNYDDGGGSDIVIDLKPATSQKDNGAGNDFVLPPELFGPKNQDNGAGNDKPTGLKPATGWVDDGAGGDYCETGATDFGQAKDSGGGGDFIWMTTDTDHDLQIVTQGRDCAGGNDKAEVNELIFGQARDDSGGQSLGRWGVLGFDEGAGSDKCLNAPRVNCRDSGGGNDMALLVEAIYVDARDLGYGTDLTSTARWLDMWTGSRAALQGDSNDWEHNLQWTVVGNTTGTVNFSITHSWGSSDLQWTSVKRRLRVTKNGTQIGSYVEQSHTTGGWSTTSTWNGIGVTVGDVIRIEHWSESPYGSCRTCTVSAASMNIAGL